MNSLPMAVVLPIALDVLREPMLVLPLISGGIYLALGDLQEALLLLAFATASASITVVQETRTERCVRQQSKFY